MIAHTSRECKEEEEEGGAESEGGEILWAVSNVQSVPPTFS